MEDLKFEKEAQSIGFEKIQVIESKEKKEVYVKGQKYMSWDIQDQIGQRLAVVSLYQSGIANQEEIAKAFSIHVNTVYNYIRTVDEEGMKGLMSDRSGPKGNWKVTPEVRGKILLTLITNKAKEYFGIQEELEKKWNLKISIESIRQVLIENGFITEQIKDIKSFEQKDFFNDYQIPQLEMSYIDDNIDTNESTFVKETENVQDKENDSCAVSVDKKGLSNYSIIEREYLDRLKRGEYNIYAGGLLFAPLLKKYNFLPIIKRIINIDTYEGYCLEQLCMTLFYFDIFGFESIENFKTVYPEEFGILVSKLNSPGIRTLRRFLHKVRKLKKGEALIYEFGKEYLRSGLVNCKVLYIDEHFLPYYGTRIISMGWFTVRGKPLKGSYNFIANDEEFNPLIFLIRSSSEDLVDKIPEITNKVREISTDAGIDSKDLTIIFDREGYSAKLFRRLDGEQGEEKVKFISWAKYADKWVNDFNSNEFKNSVMIKYNIQESDEIKYFETEKQMSKYGKIRAIVIESGRKKQRSAIYTNDWDSKSETIIQLICRRWGQENLIKTLKLRHLIDYHPGYVSEELEEQPLVENPELEELIQRKAKLINYLHTLELKLAEKMLNENKDETSWGKVKQTEVDLFADISIIKSQITLISQEMDKLPKKIKFDAAHDGIKLSELDYEKKRFLDCIKVFTYHMETKMFEILVNYYDKKKELWPALMMILKRGAYMKLEQGKLMVKIRKFKNPEIDYAARHLCDDLNKMNPVTLDKFQLPIKYEVI